MLFACIICYIYDWRCWWLLVMMFNGTIFKWCVSSSSHDLFLRCWWTTSTSFVNVIIINFFLGLLNRLNIKRSVYGTLLNKRSSLAIKHAILLIRIYLFIWLFCRLNLFFISYRQPLRIIKLTWVNRTLGGCLLLKILLS